MTKVWFITGCSSGFGKEIAAFALEKGDAVVATARKTETLDDLEGDVLKLQLDVTKREDITHAVAKAHEWKGKIDIVVNNAGFGNVGSIEETTDEQWKQLYDVNVFGLLNVTKEVLPILKKQQSGHIFNFSSVAGLLSMAGFGPYCSTKFAVEGISEALAQEVAPMNIKVTVIEPGAFQTKFVGNVVKADFGEEYAQTVGETAKMLGGLTEGAPGDPKKLAKVLYDLSEMDEPPLRILLGKDAYGWALPKLEGMVESIKAHKDISESTDFSS